VYLPLAGGALVLFLAAISQRPSVPLLVIGSFWMAIGTIGIRQWRGVAREVRLEDERITFVFPAKELTIPAAETIDIRRARGDVNQWTWLRIRTKSHGTIRVAARLRGLIELLSELRRVNSTVTHPDF
jgi:hypothetical protein